MGVFGGSKEPPPLYSKRSNCSPYLKLFVVVFVLPIRVFIYLFLYLFKQYKGQEDAYNVHTYK